MELLTKLFSEHNHAFKSMYHRLEQIQLVSNLICKKLKQRKKIFIMGNGGSASDAQHFAAELTGRFESEKRVPLPAIALSTDTSALTAISNDFGYENVFLRQAVALVEDDDVLFGISTSGESKNIIRVFENVKFKNCLKISMTGDQRSNLSQISDHTIFATSTRTARIQEIHIFIIHCICSIIDMEFRDE